MTGTHRRSSGGADRSARFRSIRILLLLVALIAALYVQTLDDGWHFDDLAELELSGAREFTPGAPRTHYRGIVTVWTWAANYRISGEDPWSYHAFNVFVHLLVSLLVYVVAVELVSQLTPPGRTARSFALIASLLFAAHPLATQSVSYVTQRSTSLAALFTLAALALYLISRREDTTWKRFGALAAALLTYQMALHAKHVALCLPVILLAFEWLASPAAVRSLRSRLLPVVPFVVLAALRVADLGPRHLVDTIAGPNDPTPARIDYLLSQTRALVTYARLAVFPLGQNLDHDFTLSRSLFEPAVLFSLAILVALGFAIVVLARRASVAAFGLILFFVALLPTSSLVPSRDLFFEHRAYLSLAGFSFAAAWAITALGQRWAPSPAILGAALIGLLSIVTMARNQVWSSELALWSDSVSKSPNKARPHVNLGLALRNLERLSEAEASYVRALGLEPDNAFVKNNLANVALARGEHDRAARLLEEAIESDPRYFEAHLNLGNVMLALGRYDEARAKYRRSLEIDPGSVPARYNLAKCAEKSQRWDEAVRGFEEVVALSPEDPLFVNDLGCAYLAAGRVNEAERTLRRAIALAPDWAVVRHNLALVLEAQGRTAAADAERAEAARLGLRPGPTP